MAQDGSSLAFSQDSDFNERSVVSTKVTDNKIELSIEAVDKILVSTEQEIKVTYRNISKEMLTDLYLDIIYPEDLEIIEVISTLFGLATRIGGIESWKKSTQK